MRFLAATLLLTAGLAWQPPVTPSGLDHVIVAVANLSAVADRYRALGFALKPGQPHTNGIQNQHVKFADGSELELLTAPAAVDPLTTIYRSHLNQGDGPAFVGFFAPNRSALTTRLNTRGYTTTRSGTLTTFPDDSALSFIFFGSRNRTPTDKPEHFAHSNGAESLFGVWVATDASAPSRLLSDLGVSVTSIQCELPDAITVLRGQLRQGEVLLLPASHQTVPGRPVIGVTLTVRSLITTRAALSSAPAWLRDAVIWRGRSAFFPPTLASGLWVELREYATDHEH